MCSQVTLRSILHAEIYVMSHRVANHVVVLVNVSALRPCHYARRHAFGRDEPDVLHVRVAREWHPVVVERRRTKQYTQSAENADGNVDDEEDAVDDKCHVLPLVTYL